MASNSNTSNNNRHHAKKKALPPQPAMFRLHSPVISAPTGTNGDDTATAAAAGDDAARNRWPSPPPPAASSGDAPSAKTDPPPPYDDDDRKSPPEKKKEDGGGSDEDSITGEINRYYSEPPEEREMKGARPLVPGGIPDGTPDDGRETAGEASPRRKKEEDETANSSGRAGDENKNKDEARKDASYLDDSDDEDEKPKFPKFAVKRPRNSVSAEAYAKRMAKRQEEEEERKKSAQAGKKSTPAERAEDAAAPEGAPTREDPPQRRPSTRVRRSTIKASEAAEAAGLKMPPEEIDEAPGVKKVKGGRRSATAAGNRKSPPEDVEEAPKRRSTRKSAAGGGPKSPPEGAAVEPRRRAVRARKEAGKKSPLPKDPKAAKSAGKKSPLPKAPKAATRKGGRKRKASVVVAEEPASSTPISADIDPDAVVSGKRTRKPSLVASEAAADADNDPDEDRRPPAKKKRSSRAKTKKKSPAPPAKANASSSHAEHHRLHRKITNTWNERIAMLRTHHARYGSCDIVRDAANVPPLLKSFVYESRKQYKKFRAGERCTLTPERVRELEGLGLDLAPLESGGTRANHDRRFQMQWDGRFAELEAYRAEHGDCLVSCVSKGALGKLGNWVRGQRKLYNKVGREGFPPSRLAKLESIGFDFDPVSSGSYLAKKRLTMFPRVDANWNKHFSNLVRYKEEHGNIIIGPNSEGAPTGLYDWIHTQRKEFKRFEARDRKALMYKAWIDKLDGIGFDWAPMKNDGFSTMLRERQSKHFTKKWTGHYEQLKEFKKKNGHCYVTRQSGSEEECLASWIHVQRKHKKNHDLSKKTPLTAERIKLLDDIGLDWAPATSGGLAKIRQIEVDAVWEGVFRKLVSFKKKSGHANPKKATPKLGVWCCRQRKLYAQNAKGESTTLTDEKIAKLESIGFRFVNTQASVLHI